jgi:hypothetical protein
MFNPMTMPTPQPAPDVTPVEAMAPIQAPAPASLPVQSLTPAPIQIEIKKPTKKTWDAEIVRRAQGIYPAEAQAKAGQAAMAKMPTPTGAWGAPK